MTENEDERSCGVCKIPKFERNNYYYGKLMTVRDHFAEQCYFNEKRWLINRMVLGWGVVCGLDVERIHVDPDDASKGYKDDKVKVKKGLAIDCCGREILICEDIIINLIPEESKCGGKKQKDEKEKNLVICLEYEECKSEQINIAPASCGRPEKYEFNRTRDSFRIRVKYEEDVNLKEPFHYICPLENRYFISEEEIKDDDVLKNFLIKNFNINWVEKAKIIRYENPETIKITYGDDSLSLRFNSEMTRADLIIQDGRTYEFFIINENEMHRGEKVHNYICRRLKKECVKCPRCPCLILARITLTGDRCPSIVHFDPCYKRKLVYNNNLLYELINCYHGDLPHITSINWPHGGEFEWEDFIHRIGRKTGHGHFVESLHGLEVTFDRDVMGVNENTFILSVIFENTDTQFNHYWYIPGTVDYTNKKATFKVTKKWFRDMWAGSFIHEGAHFQIMLRGDHITDKKTGRALDANFIGGKLPSGNGTQGGDFISWFSVKKRSKPMEEEEEKQEEMEQSERYR